MSESESGFSDYNESNEYDDDIDLVNPTPQNKHFQTSKLYLLAKELISDLSAEKGLTQAYSRQYLSENSWSIEKVEYFMQTADYNFPYYEDSQSDRKFCIKCENIKPENLLKLICNHNICKLCLSNLLKDSLCSIEDCVNLKCLKCGFLIDEQLFFEEFLDEDSLERYHNLLITSLLASKVVVLCKGNNCDIATLINDRKCEYLCKCGQNNCSSCGYSCHLPLDCEENQFWISHLPNPPVFEKTCPKGICVLVPDEEKQFCMCYCGIYFCIWCYSLSHQHYEPCENIYGLFYQINLILQKLKNSKLMIDIQCYSAHLFNLFQQYHIQLSAVDLPRDYFFDKHYLENLNNYANVDAEEIYRIITDLPKRIAFICAAICFCDFKVDYFVFRLSILFEKLVEVVHSIKNSSKINIEKLKSNVKIPLQIFESVLKDLNDSSRRYLNN